MDIDKLNIGLIGCGAISDVHAQALNALSNGKLFSAYSRDEENLKKIVSKYEVTGYTDINKFLDDPDLDAVSICTPNGTHLDFAEKAALAGKHVIIEKPIEVSLPRAQQIITVCKENNVRLAVIYQNRFLDDTVKMKEAIDNGEIGNIFLADAYVKWYRSQDYYNSGAWRGTLELDGGGVLINQAIHTIDLLLWFAGEVTSVTASIGTYTHTNIEGEDNAVALINYANDAIGSIVSSTSVIPAFKRKIEIHGDKGTAILDGDKFILLKEKSESSSAINDDNSGGSSPFSGFSIEPHMKQFEQIINAIKEDKEIVVSGEESLKSLSVVKAIYESAKQSTRINLNDFINNR